MNKRLYVIHAQHSPSSVFVVICMLHFSSHMVTPLACQMYTEDVHRRRTWLQHFLPIHHETLVEKQRVCCLYVSIPDSFTGEIDGSWLVVFVREDVIRWPCCQMRQQVNAWESNTVGESHCMSIRPADVCRNRSRMPVFKHQTTAGWVSEEPRVVLTPSASVIIPGETSGDQAVQRQQRRQIATSRIEEPANWKMKSCMAAVHMDVIGIDILGDC